VVILVYNASEGNRVYMSSQSKERAIAGFIILGLLFVGIVYGFLSLGSGSSEPKTTYSTDNFEDKVNLDIQAQQFVLQGLKSPSTAKFPTPPYDTTTDGNGLYRVISYVDSQNSFGAMLRDNWSVTMRLVGEKFVLEMLVIGDKKVYDTSSSN